MKTTRWHLYRLADGIFTGQNFSANGLKDSGHMPDAMRANVPFDCGAVAIEGDHDNLSKRVDIESGQIIDYQPPRPSSDHEWHDGVKRWKLNAAAAAKIERVNSARTRIAQLEESQHAHVRAHCIGIAGAAAELQKIHDEIITLQKDV